jgi:hypothetical protein
MRVVNDARYFDPPAAESNLYEVFKLVAVRETPPFVGVTLRSEYSHKKNLSFHNMIINKRKVQGAVMPRIRGTSRI